MPLSPVDLASIIVSIIAAGSAYASQRAASKASTKKVETSSRTRMEEEAFERARKFDIDTIQRQDAEILDVLNKNKELNEDIKILHTDNLQLHADNEKLRIDNKILLEEVKQLRAEVALLRYGVPPEQRTSSE